MKNKFRTYLLLLMDSAMVFTELRVLLSAWNRSGSEMFRYYTQDSNILALVACLLCLSAEICCLLRRRMPPAWAKVVRYIAACCLMVTFLISACILVPMERHNTFHSFMLEGSSLYLHTVCPLLLLASAFVHGSPRLSLKHTLLPLIPTLIYGVVTIIMNLRGAYSGPYPFLRFHEQTPAETAFWLCAIPLGNWLLACVLRILTNLTSD